MKIGDIVRLRHSFKPSSDCSQDYSFGVVAGLVFDNGQDKDNSELTEIVLNLYDPNTSTTYVDEAGVAPIYSFYPNEIIT
ncbi:MAG: hypothetical protein QNJ46_30885 [Leptolyngbyaceae cyanobacterium MO_188.B28]|nr:hypothetical protein [Leptolyngbyaceae cyanobacterium MO_188.B28]